MGKTGRRGLRHLDAAGRERVKELLTCGTCMSPVTFGQRSGGRWFATVHHAGNCPALPPEMAAAGRSDYRVDEPQLWSIDNVNGGRGDE